MLTKKKLEVFLSSDIKEFRRQRTKLAGMINRMPFLQSTPLEARGADTDDVIQASLNGVRDADIYVGIFGKNYSETTIKEYQEAVKEHKLSLTYVKRTKGRNPDLDEFVKNELSGRFKYHNFRTARELETQIKKDLNSQLSRILVRGTQSIQRSKKQAQTAESRARRLESHSLQVPSYIAFMNKASLAFKHGDYLQSVIMSSMAVEVVLREFMKRRKIEENLRIPLGQLIVSSQHNRIVTSAEAGQLREIAHVRNSTLHEGQIPSRDSAGWVLNIAGGLVGRLSKGDDNPTESDSAARNDTEK